LIRSSVLPPAPDEVQPAAGGKVKEKQYRSLEKKLLASDRERKVLQDEYEELEEHYAALRRKQASEHVERHAVIEDLDKQHQSLKAAYEANQAECDALRRQIATLESGGDIMQRSTRLKLELDEARTENAALQARSRRGFSVDSTERTIHHQQVADLRQQLADARTMEEEYRRNYHAMRAKVEKAEKELKSPRGPIVSESQFRSPREQKEEDLTRKNHALSREIEVLQERLSAKEHESSELKEMGDRLVERDKEMNDLQSKLEAHDRQESISQHAHLPAQRARVAGLENQVKELEHQVQTLTHERRAHDSQLESLHDENRSLSSKVETLELRLSLYESPDAGTAEQELSEARSKIANLEDRLGELAENLGSETHSHSESKNEWRLQVTDLRRLNEAQAAQAKGHLQRIRELESQTHSLIEEAEKLRGQIADLRHLNETQGRDVKHHMQRAAELERREGEGVKEKEEQVNLLLQRIRELEGHPVAGASHNQSVLVREEDSAHFRDANQSTALVSPGNLATIEPGSNSMSPTRARRDSDLPSRSDWRAYANHAPEPRRRSASDASTEQVILEPREVTDSSSASSGRRKSHQRDHRASDDSLHEIPETHELPRLPESNASGEQNPKVGTASRSRRHSDLHEPTRRTQEPRRHSSHDAFTLGLETGQQEIEKPALDMPRLSTPGLVVLGDS